MHTACRLVPLYFSCRLERALVVSCRLELGLSVACRIQRALGVAFRRIQRLGPVVSHIGIEDILVTSASALGLFIARKSRLPPPLYLSVLCGVSRGRLSKRQAQPRAHHTI